MIPTEAFFITDIVMNSAPFKSGRTLINKYLHNFL